MRLLQSPGVSGGGRSPLALGAMPKPSQRAVITIVSFMAIVLVVGLLAGLRGRPARSRPFFSPAPSVLTLHVLGSATNYLKFDRDHNWKAFYVSNGTSKTLFYTVTEIEYRTADGWRSAGSWLSNTLTSASLMTRRETAGEISPGTTDVFYATIATSSPSWRLRLGCFEHGWSDSLIALRVRRLGSPIGGLSPTNSKSWTGRRYELISEEIAP